MPFHGWVMSTLKSVLLRKSNAPKTKVKNNILSNFVSDIFLALSYAHRGRKKVTIFNQEGPKVAFFRGVYFGSRQPCQNRVVRASCFLHCKLFAPGFRSSISEAKWNRSRQIFNACLAINSCAPRSERPIFRSIFLCQAFIEKARPKQQISLLKIIFFLLLLAGSVQRVQWMTCAVLNTFNQPEHCSIEIRSPGPLINQMDRRSYTQMSEKGSSDGRKSTILMTIAHYNKTTFSNLMVTYPYSIRTRFRSSVNGKNVPQNL